MKRRSVMKLLLGSWLMTLSMLAAAYEEPAYELRSTAVDYEVRYYAPYLVAQTTVQGDFGDTGIKGFRRLAGYIFGANSQLQSDGQRESVRMAMTTPVTRQRTADQQRATTYSFVMEAAYTEETLPVPDSEAVTIHRHPGGLMAVLRYSGRTTEKRFNAHVAELLAALERDKVVVTGEAVSAVYDGPFTLPFRRRNEVLIPIAAVPAD